MEKQNKTVNKAKFLAVVMAMAMVFAGAFAILGGEESDATTGSDTVSATATITEAGTYYADGTVPSITVEVKDSEETPSGEGGDNGSVVTQNNVGTGVTIQVLKDKTVDIRFGAENDADVDVVSVTEKDATVSGTQISLTAPATGNVKYKAVDGQDGSDEDTVPDKPVVISGTITVDALGITFEGGGDVIFQVGSEGLTSTEDISGSIDYGISVDSADDYKYFAPGANAGSITLVAGTEVEIIDGSCIIAQGSNIVKIDVDDATLTVGYGEEYPTVGGGITEGSLTVTGGKFLDNSEDNFTPVGHVGDATTNVVILTADGVDYITNQIMNKIDEADVTEANIYGYITQKSSVDAQMNLVVNGEYVINKNVSVLTYPVTNNGTIRVFGTLGVAQADETEEPESGSATTPAEEGGPEILVGSAGYVSGNTITGNTNVVSGMDYEINGRPSSPSVGDAVVKVDLTIPAGMTFTVMVIVMVAFSSGIIVEVAYYKSFNRFICIAAYTAIQFNPCLCKSHLCSPADSTANENVYA